MLESSFKDRWHGAVGHQGGCARYRLCMFPRRLLDQDASRKQTVRHPPDFKSNGLRRAQFGYFPANRFVGIQPQSAQTLQPCGVARLGEINVVGHDSRAAFDPTIRERMLFAIVILYRRWPTLSCLRPILTRLRRVPPLRCVSRTDKDRSGLGEIDEAFAAMRKE